MRRGSRSTPIGVEDVHRVVDGVFGELDSRLESDARSLADLLGRRVVRPKIVESTARGAAYLAGLAVGFWPSRQALQQQWEIDTTFKPRTGEVLFSLRINTCS